MDQHVAAIIHVPDVRTTVDWYVSIGFTVKNTYGEDGEPIDFALMSFGSSDVMFSAGGRPSTDNRREVDLYVYTNDIDAIHERLKGRVEIVEEPHDTFYGMREVIVRDLNRFWVTFAEQTRAE